MGEQMGDYVCGSCGTTFSRDKVDDTESKRNWARF